MKKDKKETMMQPTNKVHKKNNRARGRKAEAHSSPHSGKTPGSTSIQQGGKKKRPLLKPYLPPLHKQKHERTEKPPVVRMTTTQEWFQIHLNSSSKATVYSVKNNKN